ncbi:MAG: glutathione synthase/Ribosomal protein S6 modification [Podoviridae sp. ctbj_2]|nr:MAG: glutathione synthase/Ribosomal protein S6 modification [Podoviridae sp. ctbj_2]
MTIYVVAPNACKESAKKLASFLKAKFVTKDFLSTNKEDVVFNYGMGYLTVRGMARIINPRDNVSICVDKFDTFKMLKSGGIPIPRFTTSRTMAAKLWKGHVVVRRTTTGSKNEGMEIIEMPAQLPVAPLYTQYYEHRKEIRVVVFQGEIAGVYEKEYLGDDSMWSFVPLERKKCYTKMTETCIKAANVLGMDYVGFDVLYNNTNNFVILEANSGPILTDEVGNFIKSKLL